jgi:succinate dehydrogenase / fumarate reductase iron-sulfur subunit
MELKRFRVFRFDPDGDEKPRYDQFDVPWREGMVIAEGMEYIYEHCDPTLAFRYECRTRQCGTCVVEVGGQPVMACKEPLGSAPELVLEPISSLPIIRDLVVDRELLLEEVQRVLPFDIESSEGPKPGRRVPRAIPPEVIPWIKATEQCAECFLCMVVCPAYESVPGYAGPMSFNKMGKYALDNRDRANRVLEAEEGKIFSCKSCFRCEDICPHEIPIRRISMGSMMRFSRVHRGIDR